MLDTLHVALSNTLKLLCKLEKKLVQKDNVSFDLEYGHWYVQMGGL